VSCTYLPHLERLLVVKGGSVRLVAPTPEGTFLLQGVVEDLFPKVSAFRFL
jgi:hypothetical protein